MGPDPSSAYTKVRLLGVFPMPHIRHFFSKLRMYFRDNNVIVGAT